MSSKRSRKNQKVRTPRSGKRRALLLVTLMVTVVAASVTVAYRKPLGAALGSKSNPGVEPPPTLSLSKEYIYAGGRLIATEEPGTGCGAGPSAPGQLDATAVASGVVSLTWPASPGAVDHYQVERKQSVPDSSYVVVNQYVPPAPIVSVNDNVSTGVVAYVYRVRAFDSGGCASQYGPADLATSIIFANDPLFSQSTIISAVHVTQLRQAVDAVRTTAGQGAFSWTDPPFHSLCLSVSVARIVFQQPLLGAVS